MSRVEAPERQRVEARPAVGEPHRPSLMHYRRRRRLALGLLVVLLLAACVFGGRSVLLHAARFRVSQVDVAGTVGVDPELVRAASGVWIGQPLLAVHSEEVRARVAAIPQLATVLVTRDWPSTVTVTVTERTPVALAASAAGPQLVDATGLPYQTAPRPTPPLPRLAVDRVAPDDPATRAGLAVLAVLAPEIREKLQVVEAAGPTDVTLRLTGGKQVRWGSADDAARKAAVLTALLTQPGTIFDVTAPGLPTIRR